MWKISGARRFWGQVNDIFVSLRGGHTVMISVFEGGDGSTRGGRSERSSESGDLLPDDALERNGEGAVSCMVASVYVRKWMLTC